MKKNNIIAFCVALAFCIVSFIDRNIYIFAIPKIGKTPVVTEKLQETFTTRPCYMLGTNKDLRGKISVYVFFIDDDNSSWDEESVSIYMKSAVRYGLRFLENQASFYGVELEFSVQYYASTMPEYSDKLKYKGSVINGVNDIYSDDVMDKIADNFGYSGEDALYKAYRAQDDGDEIIFATVLNKPGRSFGLMQVVDSGVDSVEFAVLFVNYLWEDIPIRRNWHLYSTFAHEIMHLYGAIDIYEDDEIKEYSLYKYPQDIMLLKTRVLGILNVSEFTAYSVGWTDSPPRLE